MLCYFVFAGLVINSVGLDFLYFVFGIGLLVLVSVVGCGVMAGCCGIIVMLYGLLFVVLNCCDAA